MELKDTVAMMISDDYILRLKAEIYQLSIRLDRLDRIINDAATGSLDISDLHYAKLRAQQTAMEAYLHCLIDRAINDNIDIQEVIFYG